MVAAYNGGPLGPAVRSARPAAARSATRASPRSPLRVANRGAMRERTDRGVPHPHRPSTGWPCCGGRHPVRTRRELRRRRTSPAGGRQRDDRRRSSDPAAGTHPHAGLSDQQRGDQPPAARACAATRAAHARDPGGGGLRRDAHPAPACGPRGVLRGRLAGCASRGGVEVAEPAALERMEGPQWAHYGP